MYRGGTQVTVYGRNLDSVSEPRITLSVVLSNISNITDTFSHQSEVMSRHSHVSHRCLLYHVSRSIMSSQVFFISLPSRTPGIVK